LHGAVNPLQRVMNFRLLALKMSALIAAFPPFSA
jgi:hypothetical protein